MMRRQTLRMISFCALIAAVVVGAILFYMKYKVSQMHDHLVHVNGSIIETTDAIHVLDAEWGYLNQPDRLKKLNQEHGKLVPLDVIQLASIDGFFEKHQAVTNKMLASTTLGEKVS